ncbi:MAG: leucine-rich repeat domain-containing protein [Muribaculaceae bacterium]|nr:leucine-rich repeat domain-containing protein [Muribaculaceae bacterium]
MKRILLLLATALSLFAAFGIETYPPEALEVFSQKYLNSLKWETKEVVNLNIGNDENRTATPVKVMRVSNDSYDEYDSEKRYMVVTVTEPGSLNKVIYNRVDDLDSLVVKGKINKKDINIIRICTLYGTLQALNLKDAEFENNTIPNDAFWNESEQWLLPSSGGMLLRAVNLRHVILPDNVREIGQRAFNQALYLEDINIPSNCTSILDYAFAYCKSMKFEKLVIPDGTTRITPFSYLYCESIEEVVLPASVKRIETAAFENSKIKTIIFPEALESIGTAAFSGCYLTEIRIPESCKKLGDHDTFSLNPTLRKINIPEGVTTVPDAFLSTCPNLEEVEMPSTITKIDQYAFFKCEKLKSITIPEGTRSIENYAFYECKSLTELEFPVSLTDIGVGSFEYLSNLRTIYSRAFWPPVCSGSVVFGPKDGTIKPFMTNKYIPVYVPRDCMKYYKGAPGWSYFNNFIETDDFTGAVEDIISDDGTDNNAIYNLQGIKVTNPAKNSIVIRNGKKTIFR